MTNAIEQLRAQSQSIAAGNRKALKDWINHEVDPDTGKSLAYTFLAWANVPDMSPEHAPYSKLSGFLQSTGYERVVRSFEKHMTPK